MSWALFVPMLWSQRKKGRPRRRVVAVRTWKARPTEAPPGMWKRCAKRKSKPKVPRPKPPATPKTFEKIASGKTTKPFRKSTSMPKARHVNN